MNTIAKPSYEEEYSFSLNDPEEFWDDAHIHGCTTIRFVGKPIPEDKVPFGIAVLNNEFNESDLKIKSELTQLIRYRIGAVTCFKNMVVAQCLPKTRSGNILRKTMRQIIYGEKYSLPSTIDDPYFLIEYQELFEEKKIY